MEPFRYTDRAEAGRLLAGSLGAYAGRPDVVVLALPRGGVPVAAEVARALGAPLDVWIVRKLGLPGFEELAMGAIATGGVVVLNERVIDALHVPRAIVDAVIERETEELRRREVSYRGGKPPIDVHGRTVILVDDGLATGATMLAAVHALRQKEPAEIVVAVPVGAPSSCEGMRENVDAVVCREMPEAFRAVGEHYVDFRQVSDDEVSALMDWTNGGATEAHAEG